MPIFITYIGCKIILYTTWSGIGLKKHKAAIHVQSIKKAAIGYGLLRAFMGIFFGLIIYFLAVAVFGMLQSFSLDRNLGFVTTYLLVYVPVRIIEWGIISLLAFKRFDKTWVAIGIVISFIADLPIILVAGGLPIGRFMC